ncbi:hypothetical protein Q5752_002349 [Cryptotrichosporon argae]
MSAQPKITLRVGSANDGAGASADDDDVVVIDSATSERRVAEAKARHEADLRKHAYVEPKEDRVSDDWQVAYVWAFIVKFGLLERIRRLECLEDFERCLTQPVANRPDDVFEGVLVKFLSNLKPGLRNLDCTNVQAHLSSYITEHLHYSPEFTVWDRPWPAHEDARGPCCSDQPNRLELGRLRYAGEEPIERTKRNPIRQVEERGGGLFELDWRERAALLRQLVDWQLTHSDAVRAVIAREYKVEPKGRKRTEEEKKRDADRKANGDVNSLAIMPLGHDRARNRIWSLDSSARLYRSGNPFKRPCPLTAICTTRAELAALTASWAEHGASQPPPAGKKASKADAAARRKVVKGIEEEAALAKRVEEEVMGRAEKEEQRVARQRKRVEDANRLLLSAEVRSTRTRRSTRKVDYTYDGFDDEDEQPRRGGRGDASHDDVPGRPVLPGERRSARVSGRNGGGSVGGSTVDDDDARSVASRATDEDGKRKRDDDDDGSEGGRGHANGDDDDEGVDWENGDARNGARDGGGSDMSDD